ncbi:MAG: alpha/beta hydrolase, partial [Anaerolineae bacterium]|nr:alpha/beta hydrolase [Anaerolineae bacterium]
LYCIRYPDGIAGLIISGAPVNADANVPGYLVTLGEMLNQVVPKLAFLKGDDYSVLSRDPEVGRAFEADPLTWTQPMRIRLGVEINRAARRARAGVASLKIPLLVLHGAADAYVNPSGSQLAYERAASTDKTLKLYPNLRHEIMNEPEKYEVLADITAWLEAHLA